MKPLRGMFLAVAFVGLSSSIETATAHSPNWTGLYFGGHAGFASSDVDWTFFNGAVTETFQQSSSGFMGGGHIGIQQHLQSNIVVGAEVSWSALDHDETSRALLTANRSRTSQIDDLFLATVRLGVAMDRWLPYVKGGYANFDVSFRTFVTSTGQPTTQSGDRENGWTVGAGLEYALAPNVVLGVEYNYVRLNIDNRNQFVFPGFIAPETVSDASADIHSVSGRISFKLGETHRGHAPLK